jgi:alkylated DNA nucleotide flippase Atl1
MRRFFCGRVCFPPWQPSALVGNVNSNRGNLKIYRHEKKRNGINSKMEDETLVQLVRDRVREIPVGQVMSYGQVGDSVGCSAREAGWAMQQRDLLESEGVAFKANGCVDMAKHQSGTLNGESKDAGKLETKKTETLELGFE